MKALVWVLVAIILILSILSLRFYNSSRSVPTRDTIMDTIYITEVVRDTLPIYIETTHTKYRVDTLYSVDSVLVPVKVPITQRRFSNTLKINERADTLTYDAFVTGYDPTLDSINFKLKYSVVNTTVVVTKPERWSDRFSLSIQAGIGYGIFTKKPDLFIGAGLSYKIR